MKSATKGQTCEAVDHENEVRCAVGSGGENVEEMQEDKGLLCARNIEMQV